MASFSKSFHQPIFSFDWPIAASGPSLIFEIGKQIIGINLHASLDGQPWWYCTGILERQQIEHPFAGAPTVVGGHGAVWHTVCVNVSYRSEREAELGSVSIRQVARFRGRKIKNHLGFFSHTFTLLLSFSSTLHTASHHPRVRKCTMAMTPTYIHE